jgi:lipid A ethanolaminephosphotransferase
MPWAIAPDVQTHVPFVVWMSPAFGAGRGVDAQCMRRTSAQPVSHDNLFHSLLGIFDVKTQAYDPGLDIFAACRNSAQHAVTQAETRP